MLEREDRKEEQVKGSQSTRQQGSSQAMEEFPPPLQTVRRPPLSAGQQQQPQQRLHHYSSSQRLMVGAGSSFTTAGALPPSSGSSSTGAENSNPAPAPRLEASVPLRRVVRPSLALQDHDSFLGWHGSSGETTAKKDDRAREHGVTTAVRRAAGAFDNSHTANNNNTHRSRRIRASPELTAGRATLRRTFRLAPRGDDGPEVGVPSQGTVASYSSANPATTAAAATANSSEARPKHHQGSRRSDCGDGDCANGPARRRSSNSPPSRIRSITALRPTPFVATSHGTGITDVGDPSQPCPLPTPGLRRARRRRRLLPGVVDDWGIPLVEPVPPPTVRGDADHHDDDNAAEPHHRYYWWTWSNPTRDADKGDDQPPPPPTQQQHPQQPGLATITSVVAMADDPPTNHRPVINPPGHAGNHPLPACRDVFYDARVFCEAPPRTHGPPRLLRRRDPPTAEEDIETTFGLHYRELPGGLTAPRRKPAVVPVVHHPTQTSGVRNRGREDGTAAGPAVPVVHNPPPPSGARKRGRGDGAVAGPTLQRQPKRSLSLGSTAADTDAAPSTNKNATKTTTPTKEVIRIGTDFQACLSPRRPSLATAVSGVFSNSAMDSPFRGKIDSEIHGRVLWDPQMAAHAKRQGQDGNRSWPKRW